MLQVGVHFLPLLVYVETEALAKQWLEVFSDSAECDPEDVGVGGCVENDSECCVIKDYLAELSPKPSSFADYVKAREKRKKIGASFFLFVGAGESSSFFTLRASRPLLE